MIAGEDALQVALVDLRCQRMQQFNRVVAENALAWQHGPGDAFGDRRRRRQGDQVGVLALVHRHLGEQAHAETGAHVGLDQVGIARGHRQLRLQAGFGERAAQRRLRAHRRLVTDQRLRSQLGQRRHDVIAREGVRTLHQHHALPTEQGDGDAAGGRFARGADQGEIGFAAREQFQHLAFRTRQQVHADARIGLFELRDRGRQHEARLRMRGGEDEATVAVAALVGGVGTDVGGFGEQAARMREHLDAGGGDAFEAAALACEQQETEFVLELLELLGQAGLRGVHAFGGLGDVEAGIGDGGEIAELREGHGGVDGRSGCGAGVPAGITEADERRQVHIGVDFIFVSLYADGWINISRYLDSLSSAGHALGA